MNGYSLLRVENDSDDKVNQFIISEETALTIHNDGSPKNSQNNNVALAFTVEDVDLEYDRLLLMGIEVLEKPSTRPWGARNMHFQDPDGNHVYFRSFPKPGQEDSQ